MYDTKHKEIHKNIKLETIIYTHKTYEAQKMSWQNIMNYYHLMLNIFLIVLILNQIKEIMSRTAFYYFKLFLLIV